MAALNNSERRVVIVIEELNRAQAAAVFGELFLLLDRNPSGESTYDCDFPTAEFASWYVRNARVAVDSIKMRIPANLSIFATMNSAVLIVAGK
jgi:5-methylcytosine-specific restriction endonuclease McrBC GTP-binding regulatory subunit McrB